MRRHNGNDKGNKWRELYIRQTTFGDSNKPNDHYGDKWRELYVQQMQSGAKGKEKPTPNYGEKWRELYNRQIRVGEGNHDSDTAAFISMAIELKDEGNRLFHRRDYAGALVKYDKAIKLLPNGHADIGYLRSNMAECYMQRVIHDYPRAIHECTLALEVTPKYSKALLKRARCYEALNMLDLAVVDVREVLEMDPSNQMANDIEARLKRTFERQGSRFDLVPLQPKETIDESRSNQKGKKIEEEKSTEDKLVVEEERIATTSSDTTCSENEVKRKVKLVFREEIRWAQIPSNCDISKLRKTISDRFPNSKSIVVKFKDEDGDLVTITTTEELNWAQESLGGSSMKLYIVEVDPLQDPFYEKGKKHRKNSDTSIENGQEHVGKKKEANAEMTCITDWILQFATFFKNYVGFDIDAHIDLHQVGIKIYSEAMEETVTSEEAQDLFEIAGDKFQELAALALFNWGNVHMSRARRKVYLKDDSVVEQVKNAYEWALNELELAGERFEEALKIKPDFHEAVLALGLQQFEQAKLSWYYAIGTKVDLEIWPSGEVLMLYDNAEENMERGLKLWDELEKKHLEDLSTQNKMETLMLKMKIDNLFKHISVEEVEEQASNVRSQIYVLWGTMLYERSIMEFKLGLPVWHECLEVSIEKFELAGASSADISVMMKCHCSNETGLESYGFNIDEIVQAWNEMYEAKKWQRSITSFRLEPLLRRRVSKLYYALESV